MFNLSSIRSLTRSLFPKGRAFNYPKSGVLDKLMNGLTLSEKRLFDDLGSTFNSVIPDNGDFNEDDAAAWERRLGIPASSATTLDLRKQAIIQKYNYPNSDAPRQHWKFIENQLRSAGFNVRVYENNFDGVAYSPEYILSEYGTLYHSDDTMHFDTTQHYGFPLIGIFHSDSVQHFTEVEHGGRFNSVVANSIDEDIDGSFVIGDNYRSTFFIAGDTFPEFAQVPYERKREFRHLLLLLKPAQTVGILFVNFRDDDIFSEEFTEEFD